MLTLSSEVRDRLAEGATVEEIEADLLTRYDLPTDERDALVLYAMARAEHLRPPAVTIIGN